jgi:hypothetical protein
MTIVAKLLEAAPYLETPHGALPNISTVRGLLRDYYREAAG